MTLRPSGLRTQGLEILIETSGTAEAAAPGRRTPPRHIESAIGSGLTLKQVAQKTSGELVRQPRQGVRLARPTCWLHSGSGEPHILVGQSKNLAFPFKDTGAWSMVFR